MKRALISVYSKEGIIEFVRGLESLNFEIISTDGTYKFLKKEGIKNLKKVEEITGFPEIMNSRVKTLHPKIHGGILADRGSHEHLKQAKKNQIEMIDMVVCNLYPFEETVNKSTVTEEEAIENIDIGGPTMIRAAAKNYQNVYVVIDPADYQKALSQLSVKSENKNQDSLGFRRMLAQKAFEYTARYDEVINNYFSGNQNLNLHFQRLYDLRYGENPHQKAAVYKCVNNEQGFVDVEVLHGKQLSYNNLLDADAALSLIKEFDEPAAAVIKHSNPCGCAVADDITRAFIKAYQADSKSAFGGIIVLNRDSNKKIAEEINKVFTEMVMAPDYEDEALSILKQRKNIRILKIKNLRLKTKNQKEYRFIKGGVLEQDENSHQLTKNDLQIVTKKKPTESEIEEMLFAWKVLKHVKSNAVILVKDKVTVGIGAGQMSRVDSVEIAINKAGNRVKGSIAASDSFFPFRDSIDKLAQSGVKSIIQQGGSVKDEDVIKAANENKVAMVFTGVRAFKH